MACGFIAMVAFLLALFLTFVNNAVKRRGGRMSRAFCCLSSGEGRLSGVFSHSNLCRLDATTTSSPALSSKLSAAFRVTAKTILLAISTCQNDLSHHRPRVTDITSACNRLQALKRIPHAVPRMWATGKRCSTCPRAPLTRGLRRCAWMR